MCHNFLLEQARDCSIFNAAKTLLAVQADAQIDSQLNSNEDADEGIL